MLTAHSRVETAKSSRFLQALCGHFSRKVPAEYDASRGVVSFPFGRCELRAEPDALLLRVEANDPASLDRAKEVVGGHLERFGVKEGFQVRWDAEGDRSWAGNESDAVEADASEADPADASTSEAAAG